MRALLFLFFVFGFFQISAPSAFAEPLDSTSERSLLRLDEAAGKIVIAYCEPNKVRAFRDAIKGINAIPERKDAAPLVLSTADFDGFAKAYREALSTGGSAAAIEQAALSGMVQPYTLDVKLGVIEPAPKVPLAGIGLELDQDGLGVWVLRPLPDAPAARAGILAGDRIKAIDGKPMGGLQKEEVVEYLKGEEGSSVTLTIIRLGTDISYTINRAQIKSGEVSHYLKQGVGVIQFTRFGWGTGDEVKAAILALRQQSPKPKGYILDLRNNTGGPLESIIDVIDQFVNRGPIMTIYPLGLCGLERIDRYNASPGDQTLNARIIILVNSATVSGGEIAAASMREIRQASIVGLKTRGYANVDTVVPLKVDPKYYLKLSTGKMRTTSGGDFHGIGLVPDVLVETGASGGDSAMERALQMLTATSGD
ncbi:S41 family peptidase [Aquidulcibacter sp.]|uniref:S41 family peptidase n=1 Tax=Aquidulcibacter sp. TaxID=2052990 RepID=UPI0025BDCFB7|nr:S41 family peptidase [Aquidulcibacter sp.]MCA3697324.1 PDZ domain-containing protein [Aquidulcibacter sp.]